MVRQILTDQYSASTCRIYKPVPMNEPVVHHEKEKAKQPRYIIKQTKKMVKEYEKRITPRPASAVAEAVSAVRVSANPRHVREVADKLVIPPGYTLMEQSRLEAERRTLVGREDIALEEAERAKQLASIALKAEQADLSQLYRDVYNSFESDDLKPFVESGEIVKPSVFTNMKKTDQIEMLAPLVGGMDELDRMFED